MNREDDLCIAHAADNPEGDCFVCDKEQAGEEGHEPAYREALTMLNEACEEAKRNTPEGSRLGAVSLRALVYMEEKLWAAIGEKAPKSLVARIEEGE